ncbi:heparinase II/III family protein [Sulfuriroseicoccus oceanibius]|uniref:Alginate lyase family protein n=1 Tax=Sulfuriroseicoccus oceanibius TaxID=2707525 RepID=A0A6B3L9V0_9BACT|nr:heparinase II/III family protein [Sulfuriroseicoccus oceanibius]QQL44306.1 alginate lyase family protein [Sulfuriroseicoccus oceanibius]
MSQIVGQVRVRVQNRLRDPERILASVDGTGWQVRAGLGELDLCDPVPPQSAADLGGGTFVFIGRRHTFTGAVDWTAEGLPRLWQYNLQYFDWLWSLLKAESGKQKAEIDLAARGKDESGRQKKAESGKRKAEIDCWDVVRMYVFDWIERHPPVKGACGWEPYPTSLRLMNWALLFGVRYREQFVADGEFHDAVMASIAKQVRWLELNLETHIQANHLLENLAALACVGSVLEGTQARATLKRVMPLLERELAEQILPDGLHYERSAMYHLRMLWLVEMLGATMSPVEERSLSLGSSDLGDLAARMRGALGMMRHPDGGIAQFNDAVRGVYNDGWSDAPEIGAWALPDAGYYGFRNVDGDYLAVDAGAIGPDYQPGHAHADYLSFELSLDGQRIITDTGVGTYDAGEMRRFDRSTAAHSTVEVAGENSCEVWGAFRVGRRVEPRVNEWIPGANSMVLDAEHGGYVHLPCKAVHRRRIEWENDGLVIEDRVRLVSPARLVSRLCFAPGVSLEVADGAAVIRSNGRSYALSWNADVDVQVENCLAHPSFGAGLERSVLVVRLPADGPEAYCRFEIRKIRGN